MSAFRTLISSLVVGALVTFGAVKAQAAGEVEKIVRQGELKIGYIPSPPGTAKDPKTGELTGFYVDAARTIAEQMGVRPVFIETTWANFVAGLQAGQFDMSIGATFATVKRATVVDFTKPIFYLGSVAVVKNDEARFASLADMNKPDVRIAVVQGTAAEDFVRRTIPNAKMTSLAGGNLTAGFMEVAAGRADASFEDLFTATRFTEQQPGVKMLFNDRPVNFLPIAWTVRKGNSELQSVLNVGLDNLLTSGQWDVIAAKYITGGRYVNEPALREFPKQAP
ncbi:amino acid ABC transporter substrate-binding protein (plasmid) [Azospirillum brasilense]|uniref:Amino acid ABC transporter substrate-binding protein n=1 Tax=Azospirillum brasilense TaxID=192 RepID=A0A4D8QV86_AZOBR|nr:MULTISPECIES: transporter substrate-binding domain-containing protein [Azospirillum]MDW7554565.1 transporter substrate-binding domain-containing protein [Azospirillum brasilense]MDW7593916.1 transporter substrate-binding domain-containing protein [Azospirillum brasilense]MDW7632295.1 transporter substrate-binding domain-containing protein [Azospirillum brasilense]MDX5950114.1 transporter substrate-binding domain-containing protein [Azospirillum brasilense]OPH13242.1 cyclohexadienyl dehydrat